MHTTHHTIIEIPPSERDRCPSDAFFGATTSVEVEFTAEWRQHRPEPENGFPSGYRTLRNVEITSISVVIRSRGYEFDAPCDIKDLPERIYADIVQQCREIAVDSGGLCFHG